VSFAGVAEYTVIAAAGAHARPAAIDKVGTALLLLANAALYRQGNATDSLYYLDFGAVMIAVGSTMGEHSTTTALVQSVSCGYPNMSCTPWCGLISSSRGSWRFT
jgi:hypothetical protein